jgi:hypothetical protein
MKLRVQRERKRKSKTEKEKPLNIYRELDRSPARQTLSVHVIAVVKV